MLRNASRTGLDERTVGAGPPHRIDPGRDEVPAPVPRDEAPLSRLQQVWALRVSLLLIDALLVAANLVHLTVNDPDEPRSPVFSNPSWDGNQDGSHAELFGHMQLVAGAVLLLLLWTTRRAAMYGAWALTLVVLVADDFLLLHERWGATLVHAASLPGVVGLRPQDVGELIVWAGMGLVLGAVLAVTTMRASPANRRTSLLLLGVVVVLAVFGVGVDQLHVIVAPHVPHAVSLGLTVLETAGELVGMTLLVLTVHAVALRPAGGARSSAGSGPRARLVPRRRFRARGRRSAG